MGGFPFSSTSIHFLITYTILCIRHPFRRWQGLTGYKRCAGTYKRGSQSNSAFPNRARHWKVHFRMEKSNIWLLGKNKMSLVWYGLTRATSVTPRSRRRLRGLDSRSLSIEEKGHSQRKNQKALRMTISRPASPYFFALNEKWATFPFFHLSALYLLASRHES